MSLRIGHSRIGHSRITRIYLYNPFKVKAFKLQPSDRKPKPVLTPEKSREEKFGENRNKYAIEHQHSATKVIAKDYFGRTFIKHHWESTVERNQGDQGRDQSRDLKLIQRLNVLTDNTIKLYPNLEKETVKAWKRAHLSKSQEFSKYKNLIESSAELKTPDNYKISKNGKKSPVRYSSRTIELAVITDPSIFMEVKARMLHGKGKDKDVITEVYRLIHELMKAAETFLLHPTISRHGGFKININGVRVLKVWGELGKMSKRNLLLSVLHDLGNYLKIINQHWDADQHSYDGVILFTGNTNYTDGDGEIN
ncbi:uncharacterized protein LOC111705106 [Eurytemora carolleeae]|uniref:uncharacterized protein LOC111705106 n=1 Tax=Eurytemora carolleeae TaxID=1294199 RepID=UPI000C75FBEC|nr:uncharacterized protein LOC111705106 [Eurytemora carolleeae]|eukprot:XP_023333316.1 uncharacterized protein LOC111705106 [Eurytemora affinis]